MISVLAIGFLLGLKHATEADHVTAVATLVTGQRSFGQIIRQGAAWGVGHSCTLLAIGLVVFALGHTLPSWLAQTLECAVGAMLMLLGADALRRSLSGRRYRSFHELGLRGPHSHAPALSGSPLRALVVGMVHGMAGSAALIVLSLGAMQSASRALLYIVTFGIGSIAGMALLSAAMAYPLRVSARKLGEGHQLITALVGAFSCAFGALVVYRIAIAA